MNYGTDSIQTLQQLETDGGNNIRSYKRRFWMLLLFSTLSMLSGMIFPEFASIANINMCYYGVGPEAINWTCLVYFVTYVLLIFPASWLMGKVGIRMTIIAGSVCNTVAAAVQFASLKPDGFSFAILSSFFASLCNLFVLSIPPCLAAAWFPSEEVSRACAVGVFGNQLGIAIGFILPPLLIPGDCSNGELIMEGKKTLAIIITVVNSVVLVLIIATFKSEPDHPPSTAQANKKDIQVSYLQSAWTMARNIHFVLLFITYGLSIGTYFAIATILNRLMVPYFPGEEVAIGWMGLLLVVPGLVGAIIAGIILDYTHKFKETTLSICFAGLVSCAVFGFLIPVKKLWIQFVTISLLGFSLPSFLPVGLEYGIELTYPESEIASSGLLSASSLFFSIIITELASAALHMGLTCVNIVLCAMLLTATIISCFITKNYRRSKKNGEAAFNTSP